MSLNTGPLNTNMYCLIILFISVLYETTEILEAKEITHVGISNSLGCLAVGQKEEWLLNGQVAFFPFEFPISNCILMH